MKAMKMLSKRSGQFPPSYWLHGIKLGEHVNGGGFGDVYNGHLCEELVAVKFARYFDAKNNAEKNAKLNKVNISILLISLRVLLTFTSTSYSIFFTKSFCGASCHILTSFLFVVCIERDPGKGWFQSGRATATWLVI